MSQVPSKEIFDKIQKLLRTYDGCKKINSEHEAETAMRLAKKLMLEYHISSYEFTNIEDSIESEQADKFSVYSIPLWICNLINIINNICNCSCILDKDPQVNGYIHTKVVFVALKDDLEQVTSLYKFFKKTIHRLCNEHVKSINGNYTNWRSFAEGFTSRLLEKSRCLNTDDDFGDVEVDDEVDDIVDDEDEFSEFVDENEKIDLSICESNKRMDIDTYLKNVKDKIAEFIARNFHAKREQLKTKTRVLMDSYQLGRNTAEKQKLPDMKKMKDATSTERQQQ